MQQQYLILSTERAFNGGYAMWWLQSRSGYTVDVGYAGLFNEDEAREIVQDARGKEIAYKYETILDKSERRHFPECAWVDVIQLRELNELKAAIEYEPNPQPSTLDRI